MTRYLCAAVCAFCAFALLPTTASAQSGDPGEAARFRLGALRFTPALVIDNAGFDDNVFNEVVNPRRDTVAAIGPQVDSSGSRSARGGSPRVRRCSPDLQTYENQRAWNTRETARFDIPVGRVKPYLEGAFANTKDRPGYEIDSRARVREGSAGVGADVQVSARTTIVAGWNRTRYRFDPNDPTGAALASALNRQSDIESVRFRYTLTPLTTWVVSAEGIQDRFSTQGGFDTNSIRTMTGFDLKPAALIAGQVRIGYRYFNELNPIVPDFQGMVAQAGLIYTVRSTKFEANVQRDVQDLGHRAASLLPVDRHRSGHHPARHSQVGSGAARRGSTSRGCGGGGQSGAHARPVVAGGRRHRLSRGPGAAGRLRRHLRPAPLGSRSVEAL